MSRNMKESNVDWIGEIPETWILGKVKNKFYHHKDVAKERSSMYERVSLTMNGVLLRDKDDANGLQPENFNGYQIVNKQDIIFKLIDLENVNTSRVGRSCYEGITSPAYILLHEKESISKYYDYYFMNLYYQEVFNNIGGNGVRSAINKDDLLNVPILIPAKEEQEKIANYLDKKLSKIDRLIEDNKKIIELLEECRKSYITKIITKGLNNNCEFKESGISWIGKIPKHWKIISLKRLGNARNGLSYNPDDIVEKGTLVLRSSNIQNNILSLEDNVYVKKEIPENLRLKENDLLICSRNGSRKLIGKNVLIDSRMVGESFGAFMCVYRSKYNEFIRYALNSHIFEYYLSNFLTSTINQLTTSNLYSIKIPFTYDVEEQKMIVNHLTDKSKKIDNIINQKQQIIEKLEEYKKSLIYEVVTGKVEVQ